MQYTTRVAVLMILFILSACSTTSQSQAPRHMTGVSMGDSLTQATVTVPSSVVTGAVSMTGSVVINHREQETTPSVASFDLHDSHDTIIRALTKTRMIESTQDLSQSGMTATYHTYISTGSADFSDSLEIRVNGEKRTIPWPWGALSKEDTSQIGICLKDEHPIFPTECGLYEYSIIRLSPTGKYIEMEGHGYESSMWQMLDTRTGKIVLSNDHGIQASMWSTDGKRFAFLTGDCAIGGCTDPYGFFATKEGAFPVYEKIGDLPSWVDSDLSSVSVTGTGGE